MNHNYNVVPQTDFPACVTQQTSHSEFVQRKVFLARILITSVLLLVGVFIGISMSSSVFVSWDCANTQVSPFGTYQTGFNTELLLPTNIISLEVRKFSGNHFFLRNGTEVFQFDPRARIYVGNPSREIDDAWGELLHGRYFDISEAEARRLWGDQYNDYRDPKTGGFLGGFDVFHGLHCLNQIRRALNPDYYPRTFVHGKEHDWHCINHIRQLLQCSSVASITPSLYRPTIDKQYPDAAQPHVCRNWDKIREYTRQRYNSSTNSPKLLETGSSM